MAFELGKMIVSLLGDTSHVDGAIGRLKGAAGSLGNSFKSATSGGLTIPGLGNAKEGLEAAANAGRELKNQLLGMSGINLDNILKLATLAGAVSLIGAATKKFMDLQDEMKNVEFRFRVLGLETKENTAKLFAYGKQMQETFNIGATEARKLAMSALTKSVNPGRYQEMTSSAVAMGNALSISNEKALHVIEQLEAGNTHVLRGLHPIFKVMIQQGASRFAMEAKINEMVQQGTQIAKERANTYAGQMMRMGHSFDALKTAMANALGPAFAPIVAKLADGMNYLTRKIEEFVKANGEATGGIVRMGAGFGLAALGAVLFRGKIGGILSVVRGLVPAVGGLWEAFKVGYDATPIGAILRGLRAFKRIVGDLLVFVIRVGARMAFSLFGPTIISATIATAKLIIYTGATTALSIATGAAAVSVRLFSIALKGALAATGIGLLIGFIGMLMGVEDTFGQAGNGAKGFGAQIKEAFNEVLEALKPVWEWIQVEGVIVFKALVASARQMWENLKLLWENLKGAWAGVVQFLRENFGSAITWIEKTFGIKIDNIKEMWANFTAELAVLGLRIKQIALFIALGFAGIAHVIVWMGEVLRAVGKFIADNWTGVLINSLKTVGRAFQVLGNIASDVGKAIGAALRGEKVEFNWDDTQAAFDRLKAQANKIFAKLEVPELDMTKASPRLAAELRKVTAEIAEKKKQALEAQAKDRTNLQNRDTGKTSGAGAPASNIMIGKQDKAHFTDVVAFWKKIQEAGASTRSEMFMQQQLDQQKEMVRLLSAIKAANETAKPPAPPGGVIPR